MRVESAANQFPTSQRTSAASASAAGQAMTNSAEAFSAALATAQADGTGQPDFTAMSRQELRDWVNGRIRSGAMSLDESRPFMAMGMKIAVDSSAGSEVPAASDGTRYDFVQKVRDGMAHAQARNDHATQAMLAVALQAMQRHQG